MSGSIGRSYLIQQWNDASSYSGEMIGQRLKQSTDLYLANGKANIGLFEDKPKAPVKKKSAFESISLPDSHYERLCGLSTALDLQLDNGELSLEDWSYARRQLDTRLTKAWSRLCLARGWDENNLDTTLNGGLHFSLHDIQKAPKQPPKQRNTGWVCVDALSEENTFKALFWYVKQCMLMASKVIATAKQVIDTMKQEF